MACEKISILFVLAVLAISYVNCASEQQQSTNGQQQRDSSSGSSTGNNQGVLSNGTTQAEESHIPGRSMN